MRLLSKPNAVRRGTRPEQTQRRQGMGSPERYANREGTQVANLCYVKAGEGLPVPRSWRC